MNMIEFAMKMELDGKTFYLKHASRTSNAELKKILLALAEEEEHHYRYFKRLAENHSDATPSALTGAQTLETVRNIFEEMSQNTEESPLGGDIISTWKEALGIEEKSARFYDEKTKEEPDSGKREILRKIADEERNHVLMIDGVLTFLKHPAAFAESAQFRNFMSLEGH